MELVCLKYYEKFVTVLIQNVKYVIILTANTAYLSDNSVS